MISLPKLFKCLLFKKIERKYTGKLKPAKSKLVLKTKHTMKKNVLLGVIFCLGTCAFAQNPVHHKTKKHAVVANKHHKPSRVKKNVSKVHKTPEVGQVHGMLRKNTGTYVVAGNMGSKSRVIGEYILTPGTYVNLN